MIQYLTDNPKKFKQQLKLYSIQDVLVAAGVHDICINPAINRDHGWQLTYLKKIHHTGNFDPLVYDNDIAGKEILINASLQ